MEEYTDKVGAEDGADVGSMLWCRGYKVWFGGEEDHLIEDTEKQTEERAAIMH